MYIAANLKFRLRDMTRAFAQYVALSCRPRPGVSARPPMPMIVGAPRSGTTLLRLMLDAHPALALPPDTGFVTRAALLVGPSDRLRARFFDLVTEYPRGASNWKNIGLPAEEFRKRLDAIRPFSVSAGLLAFYESYAERNGKPRFGDKTPHYCFALPLIESVLPQAHFIHIIRDGRDTALSHRLLLDPPSREIAVLARNWERHVVHARTYSRRVRNYLEVRYESLVTDPESVLRRICDFVAIDYDAQMLTYYRRAEERMPIASPNPDLHATGEASSGTVRIARDLLGEPVRADRAYAWKRAMRSDERVAFERVAGRMLASLGYEL
jgi:hypothetical protein